jgi:hypothetical protein
MTVAAGAAGLAMCLAAHLAGAVGGGPAVVRLIAGGAVGVATYLVACRVLRVQEALAMRRLLPGR